MNLGYRCLHECDMEAYLFEAYLIGNPPEWTRFWPQVLEWISVTMLARLVCGSMVCPRILANKIWALLFISKRYTQSTEETYGFFEALKRTFRYTSNRTLMRILQVILFRSLLIHLASLLDAIFRGHPVALLFFVMICCPLLMNIFQVWLLLMLRILYRLFRSSFLTGLCQNKIFDNVRSDETSASPKHVAILQNKHKAVFCASADCCCKGKSSTLNIWLHSPIL